MQAHKPIHASQVWQQGLNDVLLKSCDTIVLKTLPLVVQCKNFSLMSAQARNNYYEKVCVFDGNLVEIFLLRIFLYSDWIQENTDQKNLCIWTRFTQWTAHRYPISFFWMLWGFNIFEWCRHIIVFNFDSVQ